MISGQKVSVEVCQDRLAAGDEHDSYSVICGDITSNVVLVSLAHELELLGMV